MLQTDQKTVSAVLLGKFRRRIQDAAKWSMIEIFCDEGNGLQLLTILTETLNHKCLTGS